MMANQKSISCVTEPACFIVISDNGYLTVFDMRDGDMVEIKLSLDTASQIIAGLRAVKWEVG